MQAAKLLEYYFKKKILQGQNMKYMYYEDYIKYIFLSLNYVIIKFETVTSKVRSVSEVYIYSQS